MRTFQEHIEEVKKEIKEISSEELKKAIDKEKVVLIDVRSENDFNKNHIPDSINLPKQLLEINLCKIVDNPQVKIIVICSKGVMSILCTKSIQDMGCSNVYSLKGGFNAWSNSGYPIE